MNLQSLNPDNPYDTRLVDNVHPGDWTNPEPDGPYNLVVIGAGTAGLVTASGAAGLGAKVALIERSLMGGDCLNVGCVPSKGLIAAARRRAAVRDAGDFGVRVPDGVETDFQAAMNRMRRLRADISPADSAARYRDMGIDVYFGEARFTGERTLEVDGKTLEFKKAAICTGARAAAPPIDGLDDVPYLTNETLFDLTELPKRLGVIGAGPIGCEMAQTFARLGSEVLLVEAQHGILPKEDKAASERVLASMKSDGVTLLCCGKELKISKAADGIRLRVDSHGTFYDEVVDELLVAVGRKPNVESLNLEAAGVAYTDKGVTVDSRLRTTNRHVFAAGDVCSKYQFTHAADFMARTVIRNALFFGRAKVDDLVIPWCTYTEPELAHVGLSEKEAEEKGIDIDTFEIDFEDLDRARLDGETNGVVRVHAQKGKDKILGATIVAGNAGELISLLTLAMTNGVGLKGLADTIFPYPTRAEAVRKTGDAYNRSRLTSAVKSIMQSYLAWRR